MNDIRPNPDELLARVERDKSRARRGRLKIFFGAAAGVGKTYAMLLATRERRAENIDVLVGLVETHGRKETLALLEGLEVLPPRQIEYRGKTLHEFDLDAALKRRPSIIVVDELAHSNVAGSRHPKRWQDIEELLEAGIDVYTALNVQHLESLNDIIGQISGIRVWETVPDTVFEGANEVELVDLPPDELLVRLKEGKVYLPQQAREAVNNFFRKGNLIALRELALRQTANRVDAQMLDYREDNAIRDIWQVSERVMVCIGPNAALAERLVRAGKRFANGLRAPWIVLYVETPELQRLPAEERDAVLRILRLAEQLGAESATLSAPDMSQAIIRIARERNVNKLVMGKPSRRGWKRWLLGSVVDTLIGQAHNINIYLLGSPQGEEHTTYNIPGLSTPRRAPLPGLTTRIASKKTGYIWALLVTLVSTLLARLMFERFELANLAMVYLLGVVYIATRYGRGPSVLASVLGVVMFDLFFVTPSYTFSVSDTQYLFTLVAMLTVAMLVSHLMANVRSQAKVASHRERRATVLYAISKELASSQTEADVVSTAVRHIYAEFGSRNVILLPDHNGHIVNPCGRSMKESLHKTDLSIAQWVFDHNEMAGQGTYTLPGAKAIYFPLSSDENTVMGVLALLPVNLRRIFLPEQQKLLETFLRLIAQAIHRLRMAEQTKKAHMQMEAEQLRNSLLSSISHDLRTPLATIVGSASALVDEEAKISRQDKLELSHAIYAEALRMSNLVNNILDMARLDAGVVELNKQWHPVEEIVGTVLTRLQKHLESRPLKVSMPPGLPMVYADAVMIEQVLINLLENALRYTPDRSALEILVESSSEAVYISLADRGPGLPPGQENRLFEKFARAKHEAAQSGVGLGLAICRAIAEAHGGTMTANNRPNGGAIFTLKLPLEQTPPTLAGEQ
ncbi:sensor histidine kinase KdpD [Candidatus Methylospira mobilis]|uniref:histidine kinase n=1 Tax=Candidatus Methylospira mobilis TaxID=1808979 RepID=A0A5Q0BQ36_9GAMM|nr:sensor histidine kinase KdpD [Candidatus Methylospira mobilis]QFY43826.1 sensor histidine kinase KdpD [Candidatus Methylospira mobilis]WNV04818.1 sensor histidine kinase KdpD [Candidatus Methylospira mobilis]